MNCTSSAVPLKSSYSSLSVCQKGLQRKLVEADYHCTHTQN